MTNANAGPEVQQDADASSSVPILRNKDGDCLFGQGILNEHNTKVAPRGLWHPTLFPFFAMNSIIATIFSPRKASQDREAASSPAAPKSSARNKKKKRMSLPEQKRERSVGFVSHRARLPLGMASFFSVSRANAVSCRGGY
jgi:hypothetical protein